MSVIVEALSLNTTIAQCDQCQLHAPKGLGVGNPQARVLLLAQNPGKPTERNTALVPFDMHLWAENRQWKSGGVLKLMLDEQQIPADDLYITNAMKCQGQTHQQYIDKCADWLEGELLNLPRLQLIVALGEVAARRVECRDTFRLSWYTSQLDAPTRWWATMVSHPAAPLYPDGISMAKYRDQWKFVGGIYRRLA